MVKGVVYFGILLLSLVLIYSLIFPKVRKGSPNLPPPVAGTALITYNNGVFNPVTLPIRKGQMIEFKNIGGQSLQIALGKHPKHEEVEGFKETVVTTGKSYYFTLWQAGIFDYHDHLKASAQGSLIVQ